jgi:hypothetical protein
MAAAGYSGTPLMQKLGIHSAMKLKLMHAPAEYFSWIGKDLSIQLATKSETVDLVHLFADKRKIFEKDMQAIEKFIRQNSSITIWVSWYKKSSGIPTDLTENIIRDYALSHGLVDVKVCAVSEAWSGLKLVVPLAKRKK